MTTKRSLKPSLSPTKIMTWLACDFKYNWTYLDARGRWFAKSKSYFSFGTSLHSVLQRFHDEKDVAVTTTDEALQALETSWVAAGYASADEMADAHAKGKDILTEYVAREVSREKVSKTLCVERSLSMEFPRFRMLGRIDRIEEYPDGTLEIVDYKSGRETVEAEQVKFDIAMGIYQLLVRDQWPDRKVTATIIALRSGHFATASLDDDEIQLFRQDIETLGNQIIDTDFSLRHPVPKSLCPSCDFLQLCQHDERFAEAYEKSDFSRQD